jgi:ABC-type lipoprotein export system ATPase subunit
MLSCRALRKSYVTERGEVLAVGGIDLEVETGRYAAVIGRSGSGKSSLMAMVGGLSRPSDGTVMIDGTDIWGLSDDKLAAFRNGCIGFVFQFASLLPTLRLVDNVALPALLGKRGDADVYGKAGMLLSRMGLGDHLDAYPSECSAGEQRRAAIARALINDPVLLLADEPTSDLDEQTEIEIMDELLAVNRELGTTLVLVTHNLSLAEQAEQIVHIAGGQIAGSQLAS